MGVGYRLVNWTRKEYLLYGVLGVETANELTWYPPAAAITTWYMLTHLGERISFVSDSYDDWPFPDGSDEDLTTYQEMTETIVDELIEKGILIDEGREIFWENEPEVYVRRLRVVDYPRQVEQ